MIRGSQLALLPAKPDAGVRIVILLIATLCAVSALPAAPAPDQTALRSPDKTYGVSTAPIKMEVYSDYQCPYCRAFYDQTLTQVIRHYVPSGKVFLVHHDFPMPMHKYSGEAALYDKQDAWGSSGDIAKYIAAAMPASDFKRVEAIVKQGAMPAPQAHFPSADAMKGITRPCPVDTYIARDIRLGYKISAPGTPDFVITYKGHTFAPVYFAVSWPVLKQLFDTLLQQ